MNKKAGESWKVLLFSGINMKTKYAVSNHGRIYSFKKKEDLINGKAKLLKGTTVSGYPALKITVGDEPRQFYVHKLVAQYFIKKTKKSHSYVLHKDYNRSNNKASNLTWAGKSQLKAHHQKSPSVRKYLSKTREKGHKLTASDVRKIKQHLFSDRPKFNVRTLSERFGVSQMQLYRIRSGENWGHVKSED